MFQLDDKGAKGNSCFAGCHIRACLDCVFTATQYDDGSNGYLRATDNFTFHCKLDGRNGRNDVSCPYSDGLVV